MVSTLGRRFRRPALAVFFFLVTLWLQWRNQAYVAELGAEGDEAAHFVTSLLVRNYAADGMPGNPVSYAERLYFHYPKVAFGVWPPLFHLSGGIWMWLFGANRLSILLFIAALATGCALLVSLLMERYFGRLAGAVAGLIFLTLPRTQMLSAEVMTDLLVALLSFAAALAFGQFLRRERARDAIWFGVLAALAILTKYNALALAFVPPLAVLMTGRFALARKAAFWIPAGIVALLAGPWYWKMQHLVWYAAQPVPGIGDIPTVAWRYAADIGRVMLWILLVPAAAGVAEWFSRDGRRRDPMWTAILAQMTAVLLFHIFVYAFFEQRYLSQLLPGLVAFAVKGAVDICRLVETRIRREHLAGAMFAALLPAMVLAPGTTVRTAKRHHGYSEIAERILADASRPRHRILISSETRGESMLIGELAVRQPRPQHVVLRASKVLASSTWMGQGYRVLHTPETLSRYVEEAGVNYLVVDRRPGEEVMAHHAMVVGMADGHGRNWKKLPPMAEGVDVYEIPQQAAAGRSPIRLDLGYTLGRDIQSVE